MTAPINRTPAHLRCATGTCPSVYEITPEHLQCPVGECQAVFEAEGELLIIGKKPSPELMANIEGRVGEDEQAIVIGKEYFSDLFQAPADRDANALRSPSSVRVRAIWDCATAIEEVYKTTILGDATHVHMLDLYMKALHGLLEAQRQGDRGEEFGSTNASPNDPHCDHLIATAFAAEREACADVAEWSADYFDRMKLPDSAAACRDVAFGIRRRSQGDRTAPDPAETAVEPDSIAENFPNPLEEPGTHPTAHEAPEATQVPKNSNIGSSDARMTQKAAGNE